VITKPAEVVPQLLPVMQVGVRAMSMVDGVSAVANVFGLPLLSVPEQWRSDAQDTVELLKQESSVEQFGAINEIVMADEAKEKKTMRGSSLRELQRLFQEKDKKQEYAGLRRIADEDGNAVWTRLTDPAKVKKAMEKRARQRRREQQRTEATVLAALQDKTSPAKQQLAEAQKKAETAAVQKKKWEERVKQAEARARAAEQQALSAAQSAPGTPALSTTAPTAPEPASPNLLSCVAQCLGQSEVLRRMDELAAQQRQTQEQQRQMQEQLSVLLPPSPQHRPSIVSDSI